MSRIVLCEYSIRSNCWVLCFGDLTCVLRCSSAADSWKSWRGTVSMCRDSLWQEQTGGAYCTHSSPHPRLTSSSQGCFSTYWYEACTFCAGVFVHMLYVLFISVGVWLFVTISIDLRMQMDSFIPFFLTWYNPRPQTLLVISTCIQGWLPVHDTRGKLLIQPMPVRGHKGLGLMLGLWSVVETCFIVDYLWFFSCFISRSSRMIKIKVHVNTTWSKCIMMFQFRWIIMMSNQVGHRKRRCSRSFFKFASFRLMSYNSPPWSEQLLQGEAGFPLGNATKFTI